MANATVRAIGLTWGVVHLEMFMDNDDPQVRVCVCVHVMTEVSLVVLMSLFNFEVGAGWEETHGQDHSCRSE